MASDRRSSSSSTSAASSFDEMLERNRRELDGMYGGIAWSGAREAAPPPGAASRAGAASAERPVVRRLNQRFGDKWRYEIAERRRDGDEVVVLCRLTLPERNVTKAQFGLARIGRAGAGAAVRGSAGGVSFSLGAGESGWLAGDGEDAAYERATDDALAKCAAML